MRSTRVALGLLLAALLATAAHAEELLLIGNPDGRNEVYTMQHDGSGLRRMFTASGSVFDAVWSPDGGRVAYVASEGAFAQIFVHDLASGTQRQLTAGAHLNDAPRWSPDGRSIAFVSTRDGNSEIYTMAADGSAQRRLTDHAGGDAAPTWSPDGRRIAFMRSIERRDIWVMDADGANAVNLTQTPKTDDGEPVWSPDSASILFTARSQGNNEIRVVDAKGGTPRALTPAEGFHHGAVFSPDGTQIAYASKAGAVGSSGVWVMRADGTSPRQLSTAPRDHYAVSWSGDGQRLYFVSMRDVQPRIFSVDVRSGAAMRLTEGAGQFSQPRARPSGRPARPD